MSIRSKLSTGAVIVLMIASAASAGPAGAGSATFWRDDDPARVKPARIQMSVGAGTILRFKHLRPWEGWGTQQAKATGQYRYPDCTPNCAAGNYKTTPAEVELRRINSCDGQRRYRIIHYDPEKRGMADGEFRMTCSGRAQYVG